MSQHAASPLDDGDDACRVAQQRTTTPPVFPESIAAVRDLLDRGLPSKAEGSLRKIIEGAAGDETLRAEASRLLSIAHEMRGRYRDTLAAVEMYEPEAARAPLDIHSDVRLQVQIALGYLLADDAPKAIALANAALRDATDYELEAETGAAYVVLSRAYQGFGEYAFAREYAEKALECYRHTGDWRGMAEAYRRSSAAHFHEGNHEKALAEFDQILNLIGDRPAAFLLSRTYSNTASISRRSPLENIRHLEKAIHYFESTELTENNVFAFGNLGYLLMIVGEWERAEATLERTLVLAADLGATNWYTAMALDSLGELATYRGDYEAAARYLERAMAIIRERKGNNDLVVCTVRYTMGGVSLAAGDMGAALDHARGAFSVAERVGNFPMRGKARLLLAEIALRRGDAETAAEEMHRVADEMIGDDFDPSFVVDHARLEGLLAEHKGDAAHAVQHFGRSLSAAEMRADKYRIGVAHLDLGRTHRRAGHAARANEHLHSAHDIFRRLGARARLSEAEEELTALAAASRNPERRISDRRRAPESPIEEASVVPSLIERMSAAAVTSREFLLRELTAVVREELGARHAVAFERDADGELHVAVAQGLEAMEAERLRHALTASDAARLFASAERFQLPAAGNKAADAVFIKLQTRFAAPVLLRVAADGAELTIEKCESNLSLAAVLRVAELGVEACALRERVRDIGESEADVEEASEQIMPGFIHTSPPMRRLVAEIQRIRSSNVTVLITGESGTGKELVARAVHQVSAIRDKQFVPFNCTAVPKELSEAYLFGYRKGAFTGATADSPGVIRSAQGGTLFLDEIGDLPLDLQPKLLRFLQEGEIQPLGEQRPMKVDVRIIAATNTNLERMVEDNRFREDLYYRLNVIRLQVPPLRERRAEIPVIVKHYVEHYAQRFGRRNVRINSQAIDLLMVADWAGNVRQLCNEIQRVVARVEDDTEITPEHLSPELRRTSTPASILAANAASISIGVQPGFPANQAATPPPPDIVAGTPLADALNELELRIIVDALARHKNNISRAARELGLTRRGLYLKLERHNLTPAVEDSSNAA